MKKEMKQTVWRKVLAWFWVLTVIFLITIKFRATIMEKVSPTYIDAPSDAYQQQIKDASRSGWGYVNDE